MHEKPSVPLKPPAPVGSMPGQPASSAPAIARMPLRPFHLDAYAHSSHFTSSIHAVMHAATLLHEPPGMHVSVASLHGLPAYHAPVLAQLVASALHDPRTAHLGVVGLKVGGCSTHTACCLATLRGP
jgi:hypothetical protein